MPAVPLLDPNTRNRRRHPIARMATNARLLPTGFDTEPNDSAFREFNGVPLTFGPPTLADDFYCVTDYRRRPGASQENVFGFIVVNRDDAACDMQKYATFSPHMPAVVTMLDEPQHGRVIIKDDTFAYIPAKGFVGYDRFNLRREFYRTNSIGQRLVKLR